MGKQLIVEIYRSFILFSLFLICAFFLETTAMAQGKDDLLRLRLIQAPTTVIPYISTGYKDRIASRIVYEPLASHDAAGELVPILAAEIPSLENGCLSPDGKSVIWKLKPNVEWADGQPFTADDVCFTFHFITDPSVNAYSAHYYEPIESVEAVDDLTVRIIFKKPNPQWTQTFVGDAGVIIPRHIFKEYTGKAAYNAPQRLAEVGTGPYRLKVFKNEEMLLIGDDLVNIVRIVYEANPLFREKGKPFFREVEIRSDNNALAAVRSVIQEGKTDFTWTNQYSLDMKSNDIIQLITPNAKGCFLSMPDPNVERLMFNFSDPENALTATTRSQNITPHPFFNDKRVRQAFAHAVDREAIVALYGNGASVTTNILVIPKKYDSPNTRYLYPFNIKRAKELLDSAGWKESKEDQIREKEGGRLSVVYQTSVNPLRQKIQKIVKKNLESIGVEVNLKFIDPSVFFNNDPSNLNSLYYFNADIQEYSFGNSLPDPTSYLGFWICREDLSKPRLISSWNRWEWCNASYDALGRQLATELDREKRRDIYIRMNEMLIEEAVVVPLVNTQKIYAISHSLKGVELTPWDRETWKIKDWQRESFNAENH